MPDEQQKFDKKRIVVLLEEILKWIRVTNSPIVGRLLSDSLRSDQEKLAYHFSDGRTSREVADVSGANYKTVTTWWKKWSSLGIVELFGVRRGDRAKRCFSLQDFGMEIPRSNKEAIRGEEEDEEGRKQSAEQRHP